MSDYRERHAAKFGRSSEMNDLIMIGDLMEVINRLIPDRPVPLPVIKQSVALPVYTIYATPNDKPVEPDAVNSMPRPATQ